MHQKIRLASAILAGAFLFLTAPASATVQDDVANITISALANSLGVTGVTVNYVSVVGQWGFTSWSAGEIGGDTIMEQINGTWNVLGQGHGQMNSVILVHYGVPQEIAAALLFGSCPRGLRQPQGTRSRATTVAVRRVDAHGKRVSTIIRCPS